MLFRGAGRLLPVAQRVGGGGGGGMPCAAASRWAARPAANLRPAAPFRAFGIEDLNVYKENENPPKIMADEEYPDWLKQMAYPQKSFEELEQMDIYTMDDADRKRYWKLHKKQKIKKQNETAGLGSL